MERTILFCLQLLQREKETKAWHSHITEFVSGQWFWISEREKTNLWLLQWHQLQRCWLPLRKGSLVHQSVSSADCPALCHGIQGLGTKTSSPTFMLTKTRRGWVWLKSVSRVQCYLGNQHVRAKNSLCDSASTNWFKTGTFSCSLLEAEYFKYLQLLPFLCFTLKILTRCCHLEADWT